MLTTCNESCCLGTSTVIDSTWPATPGIGYTMTPRSYATVMAYRDATVERNRQLYYTPQGPAVTFEVEWVAGSVDFDGLIDKLHCRVRENGGVACKALDKVKLETDGSLNTFTPPSSGDCQCSKSAAAAALSKTIERGMYEGCLRQDADGDLRYIREAGHLMGSHTPYGSRSDVKSNSQPCEDLLTSSEFGGLNRQSSMSPAGPSHTKTMVNHTRKVVDGVKVEEVKTSRYDGWDDDFNGRTKRHTGRNIEKDAGRHRSYRERSRYDRSSPSGSESVVTPRYSRFDGKDESRYDRYGIRIQEDASVVRSRYSRSKEDSETKSDRYGSDGHDAESDDEPRCCRYSHHSTGGKLRVSTVDQQPAADRYTSRDNETSCRKEGRGTSRGNKIVHDRYTGLRSTCEENKQRRWWETESENAQEVAGKAERTATPTFGGYASLYDQRHARKAEKLRGKPKLTGKIRHGGEATDRYEGRYGDDQAVGIRRERSRYDPDSGAEVDRATLRRRARYDPDSDAGEERSMYRRRSGYTSNSDTVVERSTYRRRSRYDADSDLEKEQTPYRRRSRCDADSDSDSEAATERSTYRGRRTGVSRYDAPEPSHCGQTLTTRRMERYNGSPDAYFGWADRFENPAQILAWASNLPCAKIDTSGFKLEPVLGRPRDRYDDDVSDVSPFDSVSWIGVFSTEKQEEEYKPIQFNWDSLDALYPCDVNKCDPNAARYGGDVWDEEVEESSYCGALRSFILALAELEGRDPNLEFF